MASEANTEQPQYRRKMPFPINKRIPADLIWLQWQLCELSYVYKDSNARERQAISDKYFPISNELHERFLKPKPERHPYINHAIRQINSWHNAYKRGLYAPPLFLRAVITNGRRRV